MSEMTRSTFMALHCTPEARGSARGLTPGGGPRALEVENLPRRAARLEYPTAAQRRRETASRHRVGEGLQVGPAGVRDEPGPERRELREKPREKRRHALRLLFLVQDVARDRGLGRE